MNIRLMAGLRELELSLRAWQVGARETVRTADTRGAERLLIEHLGAGGCPRQLYAMLVALDGCFGELDRCALIARVAQRMVEGRLVLVLPDRPEALLQRRAAHEGGDEHDEHEEHEERDAATVTEDERLWIEVELLDDEGAPLVGVPCEITLPCGRVESHVTDVDGLVRLDGLESSRDCLVAFPELEGVLELRERDGAGRPVDETLAVVDEDEPAWIELQLLDERDEAVAGTCCEITLPCGRVERHESDARGLVRLEGIGSRDDCLVSFPEPHVWELLESA